MILQLIKYIIYEYKRLCIFASIWDISPRWYWSNNYLRKKLSEEIRGIKYMNRCNGLNTYKNISTQWS